MPDAFSDACPTIQVYEYVGGAWSEAEHAIPVMAQIGSDGDPDVAWIDAQMGDWNAVTEHRIDAYSTDEYDVRVRILDVRDPPGESIILWEGFITNQVVDFDPSSEMIRYVARGCKHRQDGPKIYGQYHRIGVGVHMFLAGLPCVFNDRRNPIRGHNYDPGGMGLLTYFGAPTNVGDAWHALSALDYLQDHYADATISNEINLLLWGGDADLIDPTLMENVSIQGLGYWQAVIRVLNRLHYHGWINPIRTVDTGGFPQETIYVQGTGAEKTVKLAAAHTWLGLNNAETHRGRVNVDVANVVNRYVGLGSPKRFEAEFTLEEDWNGALEGAAVTNYRKPDAANPNDNWGTYQYVYRRYVLNEDDRTGTGAYDFDWLFGVEKYVQGIPRRFLSWCLPIGGRMQKPIIRISLDGGATWKEHRDATILLQDCCGIYLDGTYPPNYAAGAMGANALVRITAVVESDERVYQIWPDAGNLAAHKATWFTQQERHRVIDLPNLFHYWERDATSQHVGRTDGGVAAAAGVERDDSTALLDLLKSKLTRTEDAALAASFRIPWISIYWTPGDLITKIEGREVSLALNQGGALHYPQVVGIRWYFGDQMETELILEDWREAEP